MLYPVAINRPNDGRSPSRRASHCVPKNVANTTTNTDATARVFQELKAVGKAIGMPTSLLVLELTDYRIFAAHHPELARAVEAEGARRLSEVRAARERKPTEPAELHAVSTKEADGA